MGRVEERTVDHMWINSVQLDLDDGGGAGKRIVMLVGNGSKVGMSGEMRDMEEVKTF